MVENRVNVQIIEDCDGNKIVIINDVSFRGHKKVNWKSVRKYLKEFVGDCYEIESTAEKIYIGGYLPYEFSGSNSRIRLSHMMSKVKANASKGLPEMIKIADNPIWEENKKSKHEEEAKYGWYRYETRFGIPVYNNKKEIISYNIFNARLLINHASNNKKYLYDVVEIKKEMGRSQHDV